ncbi:MAG: pentapeptide repeat-containing protein [Oscillospiraceae bacterium]|nr:pentapeptide repeat-containing protein [Oscillospiraceae bacterium]
MDTKYENNERTASYGVSKPENADAPSGFADEFEVHDAGLHKAYFKSVSMERCCFEDLNLNTSAFLYAKMENSAFDEVSFDRGNYVNVSFNGCTFDDAKFINARMFCSDLSGLEISGCKLEGAVIEGIPIKKLLHAYHTLHPDEELPFELSEEEK